MNEISQKQLEANKQNAKLGGVKTKEGKAIARFNALKHGLLSNKVLIKGENRNNLIKLQKRIRADLKPASEIENILVDRIIANTWRLRRAMRIEKEMMEEGREKPKDTFFDDGLQIDSEDDRKITLGKAFSIDFANQNTYGKFIRYETSIERGIYRALHELQRIQSARSGEKTPVPVAIDIDVSQDS